MSEIDNLISGLNNLNTKPSSESGASSDDLDFDFAFKDEAYPTDGTIGGLPSLKKTEAGLPSPKASAGLPSPKVSAGLPSPKVSAGLPSPKMNAGLPSPKMNAGLPSPKMNAGLPSPKVSVGESEPMGTMCGLPVPRFDNKRSSSDGDVFTSSKSNAGFPSAKISGFPAAQSPLPVSQAESEMMNSVQSSQNSKPTVNSGWIRQGDFLSAEPEKNDPIGLFSDVDMKTPAPVAVQMVRNLNDSALGIVKESDNIKAPVLKMEHDDPTGAFNKAHDFDNDSGLPLMDDPLNLVGRTPSQSSVRAEKVEPECNDILNLFGTANPFGASVESEEPASVPEPFSVPEPASVPEPFSVPEPVSASEHSPEPAFKAADIPLMSAPEPVASPSSEAPAEPAHCEVPVFSGKGEVREVREEGESEEGESEEGDELVFDLNSIKSNKAKGKGKFGASASKDVATTSRNKKRTIIIGVVILVGLLILGFAAFSSFVYHESNVTEDQLSYVPSVTATKLNWELVQYDRQVGYATFYKNALENLKDNEISAQERSDTQGRILVAVTLAHTRFDNVFPESELEMLDSSVVSIAENCQSSWCALGLWSWGLLRNKEELIAKFESRISKDDADLKNVVEVAVHYSQWKPEEEAYPEMKKHGEKLLSEVSDGALKWSLVAWVVASIHRKLGQFSEANTILATMHSDDDTKFSSGAVLLEAEIQLAMDNIENAIKLTEMIQNNQYSDAEDVLRAEQLAFLAKSTILDDEEFDISLDAYLKKNLTQPENIDNAVQTCLYKNKSEFCKKTFNLIFENNQNNMVLRDAYIRILLDKLGYVMLIRPDSNCPKVVLHTVDELIENGIQQEPENVDLWKKRALVSYALQDYENAQKALLEVERGNTMIWQGAFLRDLMEYQTAQDDAEKKEGIRNKLKKYAEDVFEAEDAVSLAIALDFVGDKKTASTLISRAAQLHPEQTPILNSYFDLAVALKDRETVERVRKQLEKRHALSSEHEFAYAKFIEEMGDPSTALEKMLIMIEKEKEDIDPTYIAYVGELFFKQNQCESALPYFIQALELSGGNDAQSHYYKGRCLYQSKQFGDALNEFNEAANQDEENRLYELWVGLAYSGMNRDSDAQRSFTNVIDDYQSKSDEEKQKVKIDVIADALFYRAELRKFQNRRTETQEDYLAAIAMNPNEVRYLKGYSVFLYENEILNECVKTVNKAEALSNGSLDAVLYYVRGLAKLKLNQRNEALAEFEKAVENGYAELSDSGIIGVREPVEIYERMGYLYRDLGRKEEARKSLKKFLETTQVLSPSARKDVLSEIDKI